MFVRRVAHSAAVVLSLTLPGVTLAQGFRGGTQIKPGEECPKGTTEIRPRTCLAPQGDVPSIVDYRPKSTLANSPIPPCTLLINPVPPNGSFPERL